MKFIGILRSLNDEAGAGTKILTTSSIQSATIVFTRVSTPLLHVSDRLFSLAQVFNAIDSLDHALTFDSEYVWSSDTARVESNNV
jgi:hypothetical protein